MFAIVAMLLLSSQLGAPDTEPAADFQFALLQYPGGRWNPRPNGLPRLAWELRKRTSVASSLDVAQVRVDSTDLFEHPFLVWQGERDFPDLSDGDIRRLRQYVQRGGTILVDISDGQIYGGFSERVRRQLRRMFPQIPLARVPLEHVMYKTFYLVTRHGGRVDARSYVEGLSIDGRLAVIVYSNDLAGAVARDEFGQWDYDVGPGGASTRETTFRLGINMVMYALCLDYKDDQVHLPFILRRRR